MVSCSRTNNTLVVYGTPTNQHTVKIEPEASSLSSARELNIPDVSVKLAFALVFLVLRKSTTSLIPLTDMCSLLLGGDK